MRWIGYVATILWWSSVVTCLSTLNRGHSYKITPKPCLVAGKIQGTCMFVWECIKSQGIHLGVCVDTFMFGSCCVHNNQTNPSPPTTPPSLFSTFSTSALTITTRRPSNRPKRPSEFQFPARLPDDGKNQMVEEDPTRQPFSQTSQPDPDPEENLINEKDQITSASGDSIRTEKPWTNPTFSKTGSFGYDRPNFVSKPETKPIKVWTTTTSTETVHWTITTEPAFITKNKPTSRPSIWSSSWTTTGHRPWPSDSDRVADDEDQNLPLTDPPPTYHKPLLHPPSLSSSSSSSSSSISSSQSHYITTADKPTRRKTPPPRIATTSTSALPSSTTAPSTTSTSSTSTPPSTTRKYQGSVPTVSAAESRHGQCGVPPLFPRPETRIVGGKDAHFGRWPWQVSVRRTSFFGFSSTHRCGGAVLNENWIATAGHCVDDLLTSQIRIRVGDYDFSSVQERLPYVERGIAKKVVHPKYNFFTYEYDLALVRLETSLVFVPHISPICLPATDDLLVGENATVTGWGRLSEGGTLPSVLQEVSVPIVSNDKCKSMFLRAGRHEFIPDIFLCAGYENGGQDSCQGDSGGPLQVRGKDGRYFLAGIISWGIGCAEANLPGVCTRISKFVPWILKNVT
ncbi:hypothetical protein G9C98_000747 [Cotesia typhae]|uniref:Peptidase S1 domain-containing protein n=1 Tax=Cotesia typhae TaxID=2053667 RepID=A0A8J5R492_9HYME|nr:hypothetical protein G9C98_000747 [Cotesia typhae]